MSRTAAQPGSIPLDRPKPIICVDQVGWVIFDKADPVKTRRFLEDFGLIRLSCEGKETFYRGTGALPYAYIERRAARPAFVGAGFLAKSRADLGCLADAVKGLVEPLDRPGGGEVVRLRDPHGFVVEVAHGLAPVPPLPTRTKPLPLNTPFEKPRVNKTQRPPLEPAPVVRLGHCVVASTRFDEATEWYMRHLGLVPTDVQCLPDGRPALAFMRTDRGKTPSDHHAFVVGVGLRDEFLHCAFEVLDIDALGQGQQVLKRGGWKHSWGIGRHLLGSQLFDYWRDADGHELEHYTDGDVFDSTYPTQYSPLEPGRLWQWGADLPGDFLPKPGPGLLLHVARELLAGRMNFATLGRLLKTARTPARPWLR